MKHIFFIMSKNLFLVLILGLFGLDVLACTFDQVCNDPNCPHKKKRESSSSTEMAETDLTLPQPKKQKTTSYLSDLVKAAVQDLPNARNTLQIWIETENDEVISYEFMKEIEPWLLPLADRPGSFSRSQNILIQFYRNSSNLDKLRTLIMSPNVKVTGIAEQELLLSASQGDRPALLKLYKAYQAIPFSQHTERVKEIVIEFSIQAKQFNENMLSALINKTGVYGDLSTTTAVDLGDLKDDNPFKNLIIAAHLLSESSTVEKGKFILFKFLGVNSETYLKETALQILTLFDYQFSREELIDLNFGLLTLPSQDSKLLFASLCPAYSMNAYCLRPSGSFKLNLERLGDSIPDLGEAPPVIVSEFSKKIKETISALPVAKKSIIQEKIGKALSNVNFFLGENSRPAFKDSTYKLKHIANYLMKQEGDEEALTREMMLLVESFQVCSSGATIAIDESFNRLFIKMGGSHGNSEKFHPKIDFIVRQVKYSLVDNKLLSEAKSDSEGLIQDQRSHMIIGIRKIVGSELGLGLKGQIFPLDPLPQPNLERAFKAYHVDHPKDWKSFLLKEFFSYYTPQYLIKEFTRIANSIMSYQEICAAFEQVSLGIVEADFDYPHSSGLPQLSEKGAEHLLLKYNYLIKNGDI